jgi:hypothetical protein
MAGLEDTAWLDLAQALAGALGPGRASGRKE